MKRTILAAAAALLLGAAAQAADAPPESGPWQPGETWETAQGWRVQLTPYVWLPSLSGHVRPRAGLPTFSTSMSASEILKDLNGAFFLNATARYQRLVLMGDFTWASVSKTEDFRLPVLGLPTEIKGTVRQTSATLMGGYSIVDQPDFVIDLLGGARLWNINASVRAQIQLAPFFALGVAGSESFTWVDPIVAGRMRIQLSPDWSVIAYADVGGFGAGSKSTWQLYGTVNYRVNENLFVSVGYRHMSFDYRKGGMMLDVDMSGPLVGATWRF